MSVIAELFVVGESASWWRFVCGEMVWGRDDRKPFCFTSVSSLPNPVVKDSLELKLSSLFLFCVC